MAGVSTNLFVLRPNGGLFLLLPRAEPPFAPDFIFHPTHSMTTETTQKHQATLDAAVEALHGRTFFAAFPENPSPDIYGADADKLGREQFKAHRNQRFTELQQGEPTAWAGQEDSPYEQQPLGITYPFFRPRHAGEQRPGGVRAVAQAQAGPARRPAYRKPGRHEGALLRNCLRHHAHHRPGLHDVVSRPAAPHAADRALEAIAAGYEEQTRFPEETRWEKPMGKYNLTLHKTWRAVPKGVALVIGCSTFPDLEHGAGHVRLARDR